MLNQKRSLKDFLPLILGLLFCCVGYLLRGAPSDSDLVFTKEQEVGVLFIFIWFFISTLEWGQLVLTLLHLEKLGLFAVFATGTAFLSILATFLGHIGLIGYPFFPLILILVMSGSIFSGYLRKNVKSSYASSSPDYLYFIKDPFNLLLFGVFSVAFISILTNASLAHGTTDPFLYHLLAPRYWVDRGYIYFPKTIPTVLQSSTWEMIVILIQNLLGGPDGLGLIEGHIFSQYLHAVFGVGGCLLALSSLVSNSKALKYWTWPALLAALLSTDLRSVGWLGKNDWGILLWIFSGSILLLKSDLRSKSSIALASIFIGLGLIGKPNSVFFVAPILMVFSFQSLKSAPLKEALRSLLLSAGFILVSMAPVFIRNWIYTGCPLFPFIDSWINPNILSLHVIQYKLENAPSWHLSFDFAQKQLQWILGECAFQICIFICPFFSLVFRDSTLKVLCWVTPISALWMLSAEVGGQFVRWLGAPLVLSGFLTVLGIGELSSKISWQIPILKNRIPQAVACLALSLFLYPKVAVEDFWTLPEGPSPSYVIRSPKVHFGGDSLAWLRMNASFETPIFTTGDNQLYYLSHLSVSPVADDPVVSRIVGNLSNPSTLVHWLYEAGFRYALDVSHWANRYWTRQAALIDFAASMHPESIVYLGKNSQVIDITILEEAYTESCVQPSSFFNTPSS